MKDTEFEKKSNVHAEDMGFLGVEAKKISFPTSHVWGFGDGFTFNTHSPGFSNVGMPYYTKEQEKTFNDRYLKYLREFAAG